MIQKSISWEKILTILSMCLEWQLQNAFLSIIIRLLLHSQLILKMRSNAIFTVPKKQVSFASTSTFKYEVVLCRWWWWWDGGWRDPCSSTSTANRSHSIMFLSSFLPLSFLVSAYLKYINIHIWTTIKVTSVPNAA